MDKSKREELAWSLLVFVFFLDMISTIICMQNPGLTECNSILQYFFNLGLWGLMIFSLSVMILDLIFVKYIGRFVSYLYLKLSKNEMSEKLENRFFWFSIWLLVLLTLYCVINNFGLNYGWLN